MSSGPLLIGHRGASGYRPEHSRAAYELAIRLGVDAVEPDLVATRDGVLVVRHENEISGTTDVAARPEFAERRTMKIVDGVSATGWFTEDFDWAELATLRTRERLPGLRPQSASFDDGEPMLRLTELIELIDAAAARAGRTIGLVAEIKHPSYFASIGIDLVELTHGALAGWDGRPELVVECFEQSALTRLRERGLAARYVYLLDDSGTAADQLREHGAEAVPYAAQLTEAGLARLADEVDGVSVAKSLLLAGDGRGGAAATGLIERIHAAGLGAFTWTLRPENEFLHPAHRRGDDPAAWGDWRREFELILGTGVDGVFADHPDLVLAALGRS